MDVYGFNYENYMDLYGFIWIYMDLYGYVPGVSDLQNVQRQELKGSHPPYLNLRTCPSHSDESLRNCARCVFPWPVLLVPSGSRAEPHCWSPWIPKSLAALEVEKHPEYPRVEIQCGQPLELICINDNCLVV